MEKGFTIICNECKSKSELELKDDRLTKDTKVLNHYQGVRFVCTKCGQQLVME
jgi:hypothetical protein